MRSAQQQDIGGLTGWVIDVVGALGEPGVFLLTLVETVFPPIPSEVILPLAGFLASQGELGFLTVLVASTAGSLVGALLLYGMAAALGQRRAMAVLARMPLVDHDDAEQATDWFRRHGKVAVFTGRLLPGVRSLISLPAGAARMPLGVFCALTAAGSLLWNTILISAGYALGTQYEMVARYSEWLDYAVITAVVVAVGLLVRRRVRKVRSARLGS